jgi:hypothetical protein
MVKLTERAPRFRPAVPSHQRSGSARIFGQGQQHPGGLRAVNHHFMDNPVPRVEVGHGQHPALAVSAVVPSTKWNVLVQLPPSQPAALGVLVRVSRATPYLVLFR